jgi:hypothetical protein
MLSEDRREHIHHVYPINHPYLSQITWETDHCRKTVQNLIKALPRKTLSQARRTIARQSTE